MTEMSEDDIAMTIAKLLDIDDDIVRVAYLKQLGFDEDDIEDMLATIDELKGADTEADSDATAASLEAGLDMAADAAEDNGKDDNKYRSMSKSIMSKAISDGKNSSVTNKEELDLNGDGKPEIVTESKKDGDDNNENSSETEDEPNDAKRLNENIINAVSEHRF